MGKVREEIVMSEDLPPEENIEDWLCNLERIMIDSMKRECEKTNTSVITDNKFEVDIDD